MDRILVTRRPFRILYQIYLHFLPLWGISFFFLSLLLVYLNFEFSCLIQTRKQFVDITYIFVTYVLTFSITSVKCYWIFISNYASYKKDYSSSTSTNKLKDGWNNWSTVILYTIKNLLENAVLTSTSTINSDIKWYVHYTCTYHANDCFTLSFKYLYF